MSNTEKKTKVVVTLRDLAYVVDYYGKRREQGLDDPEYPVIMACWETLTDHDKTRLTSSAETSHRANMDEAKAILEGNAEIVLRDG